MIETLYGNIFETDAVGCSIIMECGGIGYRIKVTANTLSHLPAPRFSPDGTELSGEKIRIFTHMAVREDNVELFGFHSKEELEMFRLLIGISGVGPKAAMSILSLLTPKKLAAAVASNDSKTIARAPGIGAKTAARVTLELKDKIPKVFPTLSSFTDDTDSDDITVDILSASDKLSDAKDTLMVLGYSRAEVTAAMKKIDPEKSLEDIIKDALTVLMK